MHQFPIRTPPVPHGLRAFDCIAVWALDREHFLATTYATLIDKLKNTNAKEVDHQDETFTLLSLPDIYWIKSHIDPEHIDHLHAFIASYFYGILHGHTLHFSGAGLIKMPISPDSRVSDGGYLYLAYDEQAELCASIFGLYGELPCGRHVQGTWLPRCTHIAQSVLDLPDLQNIMLMGRVAIVSYARETTMEGLCDLRKYDTQASLFEMCPEHPVAKKI
jgi:hypothetical protein